MSKILDINCITPLQLHNRIAINQADSKVSKIMDNAQNVCFYQSDSAKQPVFNYNGYLDFDGTDDFINALNVSKFPDNQNDFTIEIQLYIPSSTSGTALGIFAVI